ncbi:MAG TPA: PQQ-binding-like beta-propeller repeat protein, partial [Roseimicrobium sp.]|nr:PQQ-binding-like beta-propeller repeat protein [Roseimicrobium sp.]
MMYARLSLTLGLTLMSGFLASTAVADNWPNWRGPNVDGSSPETGLPAKFSKTENIKWSLDLPGTSAATPVIWGDRIFLTSVNDVEKTLLAVCVDRKSGKIAWQHTMGVGVGQDPRSNFASPSAVTDGNIVVFFFGNGELAAFDFSGKVIWQRNIQKDYGQFAFQWTFSSSPVLYNQRLYLQVLQRDVPVNGRGRTDGPNDSYLLAMDPKTGKELWRHIRPADAVAESREAFSTPIPFSHNGRNELVIVGGDCITGHNPDTGKELWRWGTWNPTKIPHWRLVPSPAIGGGVILACGPKGAPVFAVKAGATGKVADADLAWTSAESRDVTTDVPTPLFYKGRFFILNGGKKILNCVEAATGKVIWSGQLDSRPVFESSPTGADGKIYFMNHKGDAFVVEAGDQFKLLHTMPMGDESDSSLR